jgi:zinc transporter
MACRSRYSGTGRYQALCAVDATRRVLEGGHRVSNVAALLEKIVDEVADTMDRMADKIGSELDVIEERILAGEAKSEMRRDLDGRRSHHHHLLSKVTPPPASRAARSPG